MLYNLPLMKPGMGIKTCQCFVCFKIFLRHFIIPDCCEIILLPGKFTKGGLSEAFWAKTLWAHSFLASSLPSNVENLSKCKEIKLTFSKKVLSGGTTVTSKGCRNCVVHNLSVLGNLNDCQIKKFWAQRTKLHQHCPHNVVRLLYVFCDGLVNN